MTGRELVIYILQNNLEDKPIFENGRLLGFMNKQDCALKTGVGLATVEAWFEMGTLPGFKIGDDIYIFKGGNE